MNKKVIYYDGKVVVLDENSELPEKLDRFYSEKVKETAKEYLEEMGKTLRKGRK